MAGQLRTVPGRAQLVRRHRDRREGRGRLRLEEAEALGELGRDQPTQRHVVDQHDEFDVRARGRGPTPIGTSSVTTATSASRSRPRLPSPGNGIGSRGAEESVRAALVHQRIGPERGGHLGAARPAHQRHMIHIGRAVGPLVGARQRRGASCSWKRKRGSDAGLELVRQTARAAARPLPIVERSLQRRGDVARLRSARVRSRETTTRRPSRPDFSEASFIATRPHGCRIEALLQARPAIGVVVLQRFEVQPRSASGAAGSASRT